MNPRREVTVEWDEKTKMHEIRIKYFDKYGVTAGDRVIFIDEETALAIALRILDNHQERQREKDKTP